MIGDLAATRIQAVAARSCRKVDPTGRGAKRLIATLKAEKEMWPVRAGIIVCNCVLTRSGGQL